MTVEEAEEVLEDLGLRLSGPDGNAWVIAAMTGNYLRNECDWTRERTSKLRQEAMSSNYDHLLITYATAVKNEWT